MKLIFTILIVATFGKYHQMPNFRNYHDSKTMKDKFGVVPIQQVEQFGSSIDKAAFRKYYIEKLENGPVQKIDTRARFNRWFRHFTKYCTYI